MTRLSVPRSESGLIRLYALNMRPEEARFLREPGAVAQLLGIDALDMEHVEVFPVSDLEDLGLYGYLTEGCGVSEEQLDRTALAGRKGWMLLLRSPAFGGKPVEITLPDAVEPVGAYREEGTDWSGTSIETASALPHSVPQLSPRAARRKARHIGFSLFVVVMALIIWGLAWLIL